MQQNINNMKKIRLPISELENIVSKILKQYLNLEEGNGENSGRIDGNILDISNLMSKISYSNTEFINKLDEGLIHTYNIKQVKKILLNRFKLNDSQFYIEKRNKNGTEVELGAIILNNNTSKKVIGEIKHFMRTCGYFESMPEQRVENFLIYIFEPRFTNDVTEEIRKKYKYLYHATPSIYVKKILNKGLIPKSKNTLFFYPDRIFCMRGNNLSNGQINTLKNVQAERGKHIKYDDNEYTILSINVSKLPDSIKFYVDPMSDDAIFTYDNIPPQSIGIENTL